MNNNNTIILAHGRYDLFLSTKVYCKNRLSALKDVACTYRQCNPKVKKANNGFRVINFWCNNLMNEYPHVNKIMPNMKGFINTRAKVSDFIISTEKLESP